MCFFWFMAGLWKIVTLLVFSKVSVHPHTFNIIFKLDKFTYSNCSILYPHSVDSVNNETVTTVFYQFLCSVSKSSKGNSGTCVGYTELCTLHMFLNPIQVGGGDHMALRILILNFRALSRKIKPWDLLTFPKYALGPLRAINKIMKKITFKGGKK